MRLSNFLDNFMGGFAFGMLTSNPFTSGMFFNPFMCGGYYPNRVDFETFANPFPSIWGGGGYSFMPNIQMPTTFANPGFPSVDFSGVQQSIWDFASNPQESYNKQMKFYQDQIMQIQKEQENNKLQYSSYYSPYYSPQLFTPYFFQFSPFVANNVSDAKKVADTEKTKDAEETETASVGREQQETKDVQYLSSSQDKHFSKMLEFVLPHEGGYANHKHDRGGSTYRGVTQKTYNSYRKSKKLPKRNVKEMTDKELKEIYYQIYKECGADKIADSQLAMCVFDWACHSGPNNKSLKKALKNCNGDVNKFIKARRDFIERLIANDPTQEDFRNGWNNRLKDLAAYVKTLPDNYA